MTGEAWINYVAPASELSLRSSNQVLFPFANRVPVPRRVVVTGVGVVTALGLGWQKNAEGFRAGRTAFGPVTVFDAAQQRVKSAAQVNLPPDWPSPRLTQRQRARLDRASQLLILAGQEAWAQCGWTAGEELPVVLGTTSGGMTLGEDYYRQATGKPQSRRGQPTRINQYQPQRQVLDLCAALGIAGGIQIIANACASGANAIGHAWEMVRQGRADRVLTGGYDGLSQLVFAGFDSLQALSPTQCRPFDVARDGLGLGEGAAVLALEALESARARGAEIIGEIVGYGAVTDLHHLTQPQPEGAAAWTAMTTACEGARIESGQVGYLNAHGTGTPLNDSAEAAAINRWAGNHAPSLAVSSTKASIGHLLGAAGAVETVVCLMALRGQWLPPTSTTRTVDPVCAFSLVREPVEKKFEYALTNSFGFGGANASLALRRWP